VSDRGQNQIRIFNRAKIDENHAVRETDSHLRCDRGSEPGLADAAWSRQSDELNIGPGEQVFDGRDFALAADEWSEK
jgi:hypothetical protein